MAGNVRIYVENINFRRSWTRKLRMVNCIGPSGGWTSRSALFSKIFQPLESCKWNCIRRINEAVICFLPLLAYNLLDISTIIGNVYRIYNYWIVTQQYCYHRNIYHVDTINTPSLISYLPHCKFFVINWFYIQYDSYHMWQYNGNFLWIKVNRIKIALCMTDLRNRDPRATCGFPSHDVNYARLW